MRPSDINRTDKLTQCENSEMGNILKNKVIHRLVVYRSVLKVNKLLEFIIKSELKVHHRYRVLGQFAPALFWMVYNIFIKENLLDKDVK